MMFSTKAEYGVRVMVELARRAGEDPIPLAEIAAHDGLPLAYLEHLVARLRKAGLVDSRRGSRGGYLLARSPVEITMAEVVEALEGSIAPIECISQASDGTIVCSRESDPSHICPTKLLWTRVRFAIVRTLQETTLADLVLAPALLNPLQDSASLANGASIPRAQKNKSARGTLKSIDRADPSTTSTSIPAPARAPEPEPMTTTTGA
jgi:Rrf2 family cysteine metabolism transcriptional repressor